MLRRPPRATSTDTPFPQTTLCLSGRSLVACEAIGVPGIINSVLKDAPHSTRLVVVGVCMGDDTINPFFGISKELNVQFCLGYDPMEFNESLRAIAEGDIDVTPMITGEVPLEGVADAFEALGNPDARSEEHTYELQS